MPYDMLTGDKIRIQTNPNTLTYMSYRLQLKERVITVNDGSCTTYPTEEHDSYAACIDAEMQGKILPVLGCLVPWLGDRGSCTGPLHRLPEHEDLVRWLRVIAINAFGGKQFESKKCLVPCISFYVKSKFLLTGNSKTHEKNVFALYFSDTIFVQKIVLAYNLGDLLVEAGSCLGLWLGLSVVGVFDIIVFTLMQLKMAVQHLRSLQI